MENSVSVYLPELFEKYLQKVLESIPKWVGTTASLFPRYFISFIIFLVSCYYFSCDWERFSSFLSRRIPKQRMETICKAKIVFFDCLAKFAKAYLLLFLLSFSELFLGLVLLRVKGAAGFAFLIALIDLLPVLGCGTVLIPWALFSLLAEKTALGIGLFVLYFVILIVRQLAEPKIVGTSLGLHPVISLVLVIFGLSLFGVFGMVLLPLIGTCLYKTIWTQSPEAKPSAH
jgi:sporulation integral membrane protein YtvI